jgi:phospholipid/cholesterol/gamma-HCH transport system substrate-binding protein
MPMLVDAQNRAEIKALLSNLNKTVGALQTTAGSVNSLVGHNDPKLQKVWMMQALRCKVEK